MSTTASVSGSAELDYSAPRWEYAVGALDTAIDLATAVLHATVAISESLLWIACILSSMF